MIRNWSEGLSFSKRTIRFFITKNCWKETINYSLPIIVLIHGVWSIEREKIKQQLFSRNQQIQTSRRVRLQSGHPWRCLRGKNLHFGKIFEPRQRAGRIPNHSGNSFFSKSGLFGRKCSSQFTDLGHFGSGCLLRLDFSLL